MQAVTTHGYWTISRRHRPRILFESFRPVLRTDVPLMFYCDCPSIGRVKFNR
ncbi:hypothetical protein NEOLEDRAFT_1141903 [Neolentinus lepideus HHB14362 ss-1]|uniref:Uncharacterized protein n=1 Tax=Neolentinus lepideus HHB14362 ss-1 TaxID=1314782 RepID=A0A165NF85_9AGAM|nr:hypothetical protein NEOLEDRAFT_1141903 [Neolentinus lepideus HHB14362 ss-1]